MSGTRASRGDEEDRHAGLGEMPPGRSVTAHETSRRGGVNTVSELDPLWFRKYGPPASAEFQLFCFPHAGGSASFYQPVARALADAAQVWAVQYPGRQDRRAEPAPDSIDALADEITDRLGPAASTPFAFFGHSMGAVVAYEVTRRLAQQGRTGPAALFVSGRRAPSVHRVERVHRGTDADLLRALQELAGTDARILGDEEMQRMILPAVRGDYRAIESYRHVPGHPLRCPVVALGGDGDPHASVDEIRAWAGHTTGAFELRVFSGGHFYLVDQQRHVISLLMERIVRLTAGGNVPGIVADDLMPTGKPVTAAGDG
jgi:surfactin synthase thioesterase subunit